MRVEHAIIIIIIITIPGITMALASRDAHVEKSVIVRVDVNKYKLRDATVRRSTSARTPVGGSRHRRLLHYFRQHTIFPQ